MRRRSLDFFSGQLLGRIAPADTRTHGFGRHKLPEYLHYFEQADQNDAPAKPNDDSCAPVVKVPWGNPRYVRRLERVFVEVKLFVEGLFPHWHVQLFCSLYIEVGLQGLVEAALLLEVGIEVKDATSYFENFLQGGAQTELVDAVDVDEMGHPRPSGYRGTAGW